MPSLNVIKTNPLLLKEGATNNLYQSTFLPIFQKAETQIKGLIATALFLAWPLLDLRLKILGIIRAVSLKIPQNLKDRNAYINGLIKKSDSYIALYYLPMVSKFSQVQRVVRIATQTAPRPILVTTPEQLLSLSKISTETRDLWAYQKGSPNVAWYDRELKKTMERLAADPVTTYEPGKKPISLWQKAELEVRYDHQMQMLEDLKNQGVEYAWTSSHPNCSKRCEKWQGKLMSLNQGAVDPITFRVGTLDGHAVYSLTDIMAQVDKYGYNNNIICGFNCRHKLIPYKLGAVAPEKYSGKEVAKERKIEAQMREMEREIRKLKTNEILCIKIGDIKNAKNFRTQWKSLFAHYKAFCEKNGYAWYQYRVNVI